MPKAIPLRIDDTLCEKIESAAASKYRNISNYIEKATRARLLERYLIINEEGEDNERVFTLDFHRRKDAHR